MGLPEEGDSNKAGARSPERRSAGLKDIRLWCVPTNWRNSNGAGATVPERHGVGEYGVGTGHYSLGPRVFAAGDAIVGIVDGRESSALQPKPR